MKWNADLYQNAHSYVAEYGKRSLFPYVNISKGEKILDLGCGTGVLTFELAANGAEVTGADSSEDMVKTAQKNYPEIKFMVADALDLPFNNYFDTVFSNAVFHWIKEAKLLLKNVNKALKQNGKLVCEFGAHNNIARIRNAFEESMKVYGYEYHNPFYLPAGEEYSQLLADERFKIELLEDYDRPTPLKGGKEGMQNFVEQFFNEDFKRVKKADKEKILEKTEAALRKDLWNGEIWTADYRRIKVVAVKK